MSAQTLRTISDKELAQVTGGVGVAVAGGGVAIAGAYPWYGGFYGYGYPYRGFYGYGYPRYGRFGYGYGIGYHGWGHW